MKRILILLMMVFVFSMSINVFADEEKTSVTVNTNGIKLSTHVDPVLKDGKTYIALYDIYKFLNWSVVSSFEDQKTIDNDKIILKNNISNKEMIMTIGSDICIVDGVEKSMDAAPYIDDFITMVPLRFISEEADANVRWDLKYDGFSFSLEREVNIYSSQDVSVSNGNCGLFAVSNIFGPKWLLYSILDTNQPMLMSYDMIVPQIKNCDDIELMDSANKVLKADFNGVDAEFGKSEQVSSDFDTSNLEASFKIGIFGKYTVVVNTKDQLSILIDRYEGRGSAHGTSYKRVVNIDFKDNKILYLNDLFNKDSDYQEFLIKEINLIIEKNSSVNEDYYEVDFVTKLPSQDAFYIDGKNLILFYNPYEISYGARSFVKFEIPLADLKDYLK